MSGVDFDLSKVGNPNQIITENAAKLSAGIQVTGFPQRAESIADPVAGHKPHVSPYLPCDFPEVSYSKHWERRTLLRLQFVCAGSTRI